MATKQQTAGSVPLCECGAPRFRAPAGYLSGACWTCLEALRLAFWRTMGVAAP